MSTLTVQQAHQLALQHHQAGRLADAEALYRQILAVQPNWAEAWQMLGVLANQTGRPDLALELIGRALAVEPGNGAAYSNLGVVYRSMGRLSDAAEAYQRALELLPGMPEPYHNLGDILQQLGRMDEAVAMLQRAVQLRPHDAQLRKNLGDTLRAGGRSVEAIEAYREAVRLNPKNAEAWNNLGNLLREEKRLPEALAALEQARQIAPNIAQIHHNLGAALADSGQLENAVLAYRRALQIQPALPEAFYGLGNSLVKQARLDEAIDAFRAALAIRPEYAEAWNNLGDALLEKGHLDDAVAAFRRTVTVKPDFAEAHSNLASALKDQGDMDRAIEVYRLARQLLPSHAGIHSNLIYALYFHPRVDAAAIAEEQREWQRAFGQPARRFNDWSAVDRQPERRLRIGYVSPDFFAQSESFFVVPLLEAHDHARFEIHCYASVLRPDAITEHLRRNADAWHDVRHLSDSELAEQIRADGIDILVDLTMHMANNRLLAFARRPAPIQVTWLAYPGSTGLEAIDYRLTDRYLDPPEVETPFYSERSVHLPDCWCCYHPLTEDVAVNPLPALAQPHITFGCLNHFHKINDVTLELFGRVLQEVEGSRLLLLVPLGAARSRVRRQLGRQGIAENRLEFVGKVSRQDYLAFYHRIDIALDTLPYNGITTTCDALLMGLPVVSLIGKTAAGRAGLGLLSMVQLGELVANSPDEFVAVARRLAGDLPMLAELRASLRSRLAASPLVDASRFARNMEAAYRTMWHDWCAKNSTGSPAMQIALQHHQAGRLAEAEGIYRQILAVEPQHADALHLLGVIAHQVGQHGSAVELIGKAVEINPSDAGAWSNLGEAYRVLGRLEEAMVAYRRALQLQPNQPEAYSNLGNVLRSLGRMEEAIEACRRAIQLRPEYAEAYLNLANALSECGRGAEAMAAYHRALQINPGDAEAWNSYGAVLAEGQRFEEAEAAHRRAIQLQPNHAGAICNLANMLIERGQNDEAIAAYRQVLAIKPEDAATQSNLICALQFHPLVERAAIVEERRAWDRKFGHPLAPVAVQYSNVRDPGRRLRIGYVSPDFRDHVVGRNLLPLFREHDRRQFEILCYSGVAQPDATTAEFERFADGWRRTIGVSDEALADMIREDTVDILVDLTQHMARNRLTALARRPAPVQVSFAGYPESTGLEAIGYRISDRWLEGGNDEWRMTNDERLLVDRRGERAFLLDSFWCYEPAETLEIGELPCRRNGSVTFGCLNNFCKLNDQTWKLWAQILRQVRDARLIVLCAPGGPRQRVTDVLVREGIDARRIEFVGRAPRRAYLEYYQRLDIALDSFPYNGHTTSLDALWMGVPVVSLAGNGPVSRAGWSQLSNLGLSELAAFSEDDYVRTAVELAGDILRLTELRATLRWRMEASVLMDAHRFTRQIEDAYRAMWRQWCGEKGACS